MDDLQYPSKISTSNRSREADNAREGPGTGSQLGLDGSITQFE